MKVIFSGGAPLEDYTRKMIEQNENAKIWGARMIAGGPNAIR